MPPAKDLHQNLIRALPHKKNRYRDIPWKTICDSASIPQSSAAKSPNSKNSRLRNAFDRNDFGPVNQAVDEGDDTGCVGEDFTPLGKGFVGGDDNGALLVASGHDLEEQVRVAVVVGQISGLVNDKELWIAVPTESAAQRARGVLCGEIVEHVAGRGEADKSI